MKNGVGSLIIGYNSGWKGSINIGRRNNQNFTFVSHEKFIRFLEYKCHMAGIRVIRHEESHTSKCDALAFEEICHHDHYLGKRTKRGLFQSSTGKLINADVNGALNIMRKVIGDSGYFNQIINSGRLFRPVRVNPSVVR